MQMGFTRILIGVGVTTSMLMAQEASRPASVLKALTPDVAALVAPAARNPSSIEDMNIPADLLPSFMSTTFQAIEGTLNFMDEQAKVEADVAVETLNKADANKKTILATAFASPMVQALPGISDAVKDGINQASNSVNNAQMSNSQYSGTATEVVRNVGSMSAAKDPENVVAVRMAFASAAFVNGSSEDGKASLADSLNATLPADYRGPYENGDTLVTLATQGTPDAYKQMTKITGVDIVMELLQLPPPPPVPFGEYVQRQRIPIPVEDIPPVPPPYNNQSRP